MRHGNGKFTTEEFTYIGQWQLDLKHGRGKMICNNGEVIVGTWIKDKMNGVCSVTDKNGKNVVLFKDDMKINLTYGF